MESKNKIEYLDIYDENGKTLNYSLPRSEVHKKGLFHQVVQIWIVDRNGNILIQKRSSMKEAFASLWDISCSGHIEAGKNSEETAIIELQEELGLTFLKKDLEYLFVSKKKLVINNGKYFDNEHQVNYLISIDKTLNLSQFKLQEEEVEQISVMHYSKLFEKIFNKDPSFLPIHNDTIYPQIESSPYFKLSQILSYRYPTNRME